MKKQTHEKMENEMLENTQVEKDGVNTCDISSIEEAISDEFKEYHELDEEIVDDLIHGLLDDPSEDPDALNLSEEGHEKANFLVRIGQILKGILVFFCMVLKKLFVFIFKRFDYIFKSERAILIANRTKELPKSRDGRIQIGKLILGIASFGIVLGLALSRPQVQGFDFQTLSFYDTENDQVIERITANREEITKANLIRFYEAWVRTSKADTFIIDLADGFGLIFEDTTNGHFQYNQVHVLEFEELVNDVYVTVTDTVWLTENPYIEATIRNGDIIYSGVALFQ